MLKFFLLLLVFLVSLTIFKQNNVIVFVQTKILKISYFQVKFSTNHIKRITELQVLMDVRNRCLTHLFT